MRDYRLGCFAALLMMAGLLAPAQAGEARGPFLTLEGQLGLYSGHMTESGNYTPGDPVDPWTVGGVPLNAIAGVRIETGVDLDTALGGPVRLGLIYSGNGGSNSLSQDAGGIVMGKLQPDGTTEWQISIPQTGTNHVDFTLDKRFWEVMPELMLTVPLSGGGATQVGIRPFFGEFRETSRSAYATSSGQTVSTANTLDGQVYGGMLAAQQDIELSPNLKMFFGGGVGSYFGRGTAQIVGEQNGVVIDRTGSVQGVRGQLELGTEYQVNPHVSLGTVARLDMWSAILSVSGKYGRWSADECALNPTNNDLVCEPPRIVGAYDIVSAPQTSVFIGASLTLRP